MNRRAFLKTTAMTAFVPPVGVKVAQLGVEPVAALTAPYWEVYRAGVLIGSAKTFKEGWQKIIPLLEQSPFDWELRLVSSGKGGR